MAKGRKVKAGPAAKWIRPGLQCYVARYQNQPEIGVNFFVALVRFARNHVCADVLVCVFIVPYTYALAQPLNPLLERFSVARPYYLHRQSASACRVARGHREIDLVCKTYWEAFYMLYPVPYVFCRCGLGRLQRLRIGFGRFACAGTSAPTTLVHSWVAEPSCG